MPAHTKKKQVLVAEVSAALAHTENVIRGLQGRADKYEGKSNQNLCGVLGGVVFLIGSVLLARHYNADVWLMALCASCGATFGTVAAMLSYRAAIRSTLDGRLERQRILLRECEADLLRAKAVNAPKEHVATLSETYWSGMRAYYDSAIERNNREKKGAEAPADGGASLSERPIDIGPDRSENHDVRFPLDPPRRHRVDIHASSPEGQIQASTAAIQESADTPSVSHAISDPVQDDGDNSKTDTPKLTA